MYNQNNFFQTVQPPQILYQLNAVNATIGLNNSTPLRGWLSPPSVPTTHINPTFGVSPFSQSAFVLCSRNDALHLNPSPFTIPPPGVIVNSHHRLNGARNIACISKPAVISQEASNRKRKKAENEEDKLKPSNSNERISEEICLDFMNMSKEQRARLSDDYNSTRSTVINELAVRNNGTNQSTSQQQSPIEDRESAGSIDLNPTGGESDGEHPEMARNWRMKTLFSGRIADHELPQNCPRPQSDDGRTFPPISSLKEMNGNGRTEQAPPIQEQVVVQQQQELMQQTTSASNHGFVYRNQWVSKELVEKQKQSRMNGSFGLRQPRPDLPKSNLAPERGPPTNSAPKIGQPAKRQYRMLILKNGTRMYPGPDSTECYQFAESKQCLAGLFCKFTHDGKRKHQAVGMCEGLLHGKCRNTDDNCPGGLHSPLLPHQMPICDFYLRMMCSVGASKCPYLHVKHTSGLDPCIHFNKGKCQRGVMCDSPHRYYYSTIKQKRGVPRPTNANEPQLNVAPPDAAETPQNSISSEQQATGSKKLLNWYE